MLQIETDFSYEGQPVYQLCNPDTGELTATVYEDLNMARLIAAAPTLLGALQSLLHQAQQMRGMFPDEDGTIAASVQDATAAISQTRQP